MKEEKKNHACFLVYSNVKIMGKIIIYIGRVQGGD